MRESLPLAPREPAHRIEHPVAAKAEASEVVALLLLEPACRLGAAAARELQDRGARGIQLVHLELREEAGLELG